MYRNDILFQVTCIELLDDNASEFNRLANKIKNGRPDEVAVEMLNWKGKSDLDPFTYDDILGIAKSLDERIVFDNSRLLLTYSRGMIILYRYEYFDIKDRLGKSLELGEPVIWADPDEEARDLNRVWTIFDVQSEELVRIHDISSEAEVNPKELISLKSINL